MPSFARRLNVSTSLAALMTLAMSGTSAFAQATDTQLARLEDSIARLEGQLAVQEADLDRLRDELKRQREAVSETADPASPNVSVAAPLKLIDLRAGQTQPVGIAPPEQPRPQLAALPEGVGVLTPIGRFQYDPTVEYVNSSSNRLVFRGVEIVTGVQIGVIEASDVDRNTAIASLAVRYGLSDRVDVEVRAPFVYRSDEITTLVQRQNTVTQTSKLESDEFGDVEVTARYQFTRGINGAPILVGNLRYKSDTGRGPFDIDRDAAGVALELPTGSGFHGVEPSLTILLPSDPAVLFGTVGYLWHLKRDIDRTINGVRIGNVDPGDSINASLGFGFSVNPRFSFSMSYRHSYIFPTETEINGTLQQSDDLQSGAVQFGMSYRFGEKRVVSTSFEIGATEDAPDVRVVLRVPFS